MYSLKRILLIICCICGSIGIAIAQKKGKQDTLPALPPHVKLRISPLSFFEPYAGAMIGAEWQFRERFSIGLDVAYLFIDYSGSYPVSGYKIRPEFRYYFKPQQRTNWFVAAEASYKRVNREVSGEVCSGPGCPFFQRVEYTEVKSMPGGSLKIGMLIYSNKNRRAYLEFFLGLGFKVIDKYNKNYSGPPNDNNLLDEKGIMFFEEGFSPHFPAGVKFGVRL